MSQETDWFENRRGDEERPRLIIPALIWLGLIIASIVIAVMLTG